MSKLVSLVRTYAGRIRNGRTPRDIFNHLTGEHKELAEEMDAYDAGQPAGEDGIVGEAIDVLQCCLDLIFEVRPDITDEELDAIMLRKCEKWERWYSHSIAKAAEPLPPA